MQSAMCAWRGMSISLPNNAHSLNWKPAVLFIFSSFLSMSSASNSEPSTPILKERFARSLAVVHKVFKNA
ncbi:hypothetical protein GBAR_LOCUS9210 [Geodia barretti]|uniref:Uncharacterized protein n=1 Tax=Geodia barretti TaxID=519541 RepID=A0AA35RNG4_GEOBA|nr:hypothetical protein GBAR_LOCUS9210 [Geodia barretti]